MPSGDWINIEQYAAQCPTTDLNLWELPWLVPSATDIALINRFVELGERTTDTMSVCARDWEWTQPIHRLLDTASMGETRKVSVACRDGADSWWITSVHHVSVSFYFFLPTQQRNPLDSDRVSVVTSLLHNGTSQKKSGKTEKRKKDGRGAAERSGNMVEEATGRR